MNLRTIMITISALLLAFRILEGVVVAMEVLPEQLPVAVSIAQDTNDDDDIEEEQNAEKEERRENKREQKETEKQTKKPAPTATPVPSASNTDDDDVASPIDRVVPTIPPETTAAPTNGVRKPPERITITPAITGDTRAVSPTPYVSPVPPVKTDDPDTTGGTTSDTKAPPKEPVVPDPKTEPEKVAMAVNIHKDQPAAIVPPQQEEREEEPQSPALVETVQRQVQTIAPPLGGFMEHLQDNLYLSNSLTPEQTEQFTNLALLFLFVGSVLIQPIPLGHLFKRNVTIPSRNVQ